MSKKGKILFLRTPPYDLNLSSYNVQQIGMGKAFCDKGYDFDFITFKKRNQTERTFYKNGDCRARLIEMPRTRVFRWGINLKLCKPEFLSQYDLVISQEYYQPMTYWLAKQSEKVAMYSGPYWNLFLLPITSVFYDLIVTKRLNELLLGKFVKSSMAKEYLESKGYTNVVNIGVGLDASRFCDATADPKTQALVSFMQDNDCLLYVGRLDSNKNFPFLLDTLRVAQERYPGIKLVIIGKSKQSFINRLLGRADESYAESVLSSQPERVRQAIVRIDRLDNDQLQFVYPLAKALLLPSINEIFGMVLLEAMYFGTPVISSKNGGSTTLIRGIEYGQIIEEYDAKKWAKAISNYLDDVDYSKRVVRNCKQMIKEEYNWDVITDHILVECGLS